MQHVWVIIPMLGQGCGPT